MLQPSDGRTVRNESRDDPFSLGDLNFFPVPQKMLNAGKVVPKVPNARSFHCDTL